jgi:hypothetical protein
MLLQTYELAALVLAWHTAAMRKRILVVLAVVLVVCLGLAIRDEIRTKLRANRTARIRRWLEQSAQRETGEHHLGTTNR